MIKRLEIHWSTLDAHCACQKATVYYSPAIAAKVESFVTDIVTDVLISFPIIAQRSKGTHYFHGVVSLVVINIRIWEIWWRYAKCVAGDQQQCHAAWSPGLCKDSHFDGCQALQLQIPFHHKKMNGTRFFGNSVSTFFAHFIWVMQLVLLSSCAHFSFPDALAVVVCFAVMAMAAAGTLLY